MLLTFVGGGILLVQIIIGSVIKQTWRSVLCASNAWKTWTSL